MATATVGHATLADAVWQSEGQARIVRNIVLILAGTALMAISARINVPMWPVPMTMQTFAVLVIAMAYGWKLAGATLVAYLAEGALGLPVFASGGGIAYFAGPTTGYLFGFLVAAVAVGWLAEKGWDRSPVSTFVANAIGTAIIFVLGVSWLTGFLAITNTMAFADAFGAAMTNGLTPFLFGALVKISLAAAVLPLLWKILPRGKND
ncbi:MAG: biotin transporter BioY [Alphaproteobacteria bacterium]